MSRKQKGGEVQPFPLSYYNQFRSNNTVDPGQDLAKSSGQVVRNFLPRFGTQGGKLRNRRAKGTRKAKGGFVPSVMEPFSAAASKYITPVALFSAYKFMQKKNKKSEKSKNNKKKTRRSH